MGALLQYMVYIFGVVNAVEKMGVETRGLVTAQHEGLTDSPVEGGKPLTAALRTGINEDAVIRARSSESKKMLGIRAAQLMYISHWHRANGLGPAEVVSFPLLHASLLRYHWVWASVLSACLSAFSSSCFYYQPSFV